MHIQAIHVFFYRGGSLSFDELNTLLSIFAIDQQLNNLGQIKDLCKGGFCYH